MSCSGADVCSNTSKQRLWLGFWRSRSYERWWHTKSHKTARGRCNFRPKFKRVYASNTTRPLVGVHLTRLFFFCRRFLSTCHFIFLGTFASNAFTMTISGAPSRPKLVPRLTAPAPPEQRQPSAPVPKSWSQVARGDTKEDKFKKKNEANVKPRLAPGDLEVAATTGYRRTFRISCLCTRAHTRLVFLTSHAYHCISRLEPNLTVYSEFPQLSNNAQIPGANQQSMWGGQAARNLGGPAPRNPGSAIPQQPQQDDLFSPASRLSSSQNSFRFGSQANIGQPQQPQPSGGEEFPPLNRNGNGDIGQERVASMITGLNLGSQAAVASPPTQARGSGNGLLNAVTANTRASEARSPIGMCSTWSCSICGILTIVQEVGLQKDDLPSRRMTCDRTQPFARTAPLLSQLFRTRRANL